MLAHTLAYHFEALPSTACVLFGPASHWTRLDAHPEIQHEVVRLTKQGSLWTRV